MDTHPYAAWIELSRPALLHNLEILKKHIAPEVQIRAVVKANAYGHGLEPVATALAAAGVRHFGVATLAEGQQMKRLMPEHSILLLGALWQEHYRPAIEKGLELMLHTSTHIPLLERIAQEVGKPARIHIKVDTGMGRTGLSLDELPAVQALLQETSHLRLVSLCSHFATSDEPASGYVRQQLTLFEEARRLLPWPGLNLHIANSDAIFAYPDSHYDQVRPGLALYGYCSYARIPLQPVLALKARFTQLKYVPRGTFISYGRTFSTGRDSLIGLMPVGYADGVNRLLSNHQSVLVHGHRAPIIGRVTMDQTLVDVTGIPGVEPGTVATLIGTDGPEYISAREWAERCGTIPYEILTSMGQRLERLLV